jgi:hypothetical protein
MRARGTTRLAGESAMHDGSVDGGQAGGVCQVVV